MYKNECLLGTGNFYKSNTKNIYEVGAYLPLLKATSMAFSQNTRVAFYIDHVSTGCLMRGQVVIYIQTDHYPYNQMMVFLSTSNTECKNFSSLVL